MLFEQWLNQSPKQKKKPLQDQVTVQGISVPVSIYIEQRKNYRSSFTKKGVNIRIPKRSSTEKKRKQINHCKEWAKELLNRKSNLLSRYEKIIYKNDHVISTFEQDFYLKIVYKDRKTIGNHIEGNLLELRIPKTKTAEIIKPKHLSKALADHYRQFLQERLNYWNELFSVDHQKLRLKYNSSNWGSCSTKKNINLSTRLLLCPLTIIDYIMVHELAHLVHPNHSSDFWAEVERIMPDYKEKEHWLKTTGAHLDF